MMKRKMERCRWNGGCLNGRSLNLKGQFPGLNEKYKRRHQQLHWYCNGIEKEYEMDGEVEGEGEEDNCENKFPSKRRLLLLYTRANELIYLSKYELNKQVHRHTGRLIRVCTVFFST